MGPAVRVSWRQQQLHVQQERPICPALQQQDGQVIRESETSTSRSVLRESGVQQKSGS